METKTFKFSNVLTILDRKFVNIYSLAISTVFWSLKLSFEFILEFLEHLASKICDVCFQNFEFSKIPNFFNSDESVFENINVELFEFFLLFFFYLFFYI